VQKELDLPSGQILGLFTRLTHKFVQLFKKIQESALDKALPIATPSSTELQPLPKTIDQELVWTKFYSSIFPWYLPCVFWYCFYCNTVYVVTCDWVIPPQATTADKKLDGLDLSEWVSTQYWPVHFIPINALITGNIRCLDYVQCINYVLFLLIATQPKSE